jgi:ankyrin repeat protein
MAALLIDRGADVNAHTANASPPLAEAVLRDYTEVAGLLLEAGADPTLSRASGASPLELAIRSHRLPLLALLLRYIPKPDPALLTQAVAAGFPDLIPVLLDAGIDGSTALHDAALKGQAAMLRLLLEKTANPNHKSKSGATPLHDAALAGKVEAVTILLNHGARIDERETDSGDTPLYMAAAFGREEVALLLLEKGADPNLPDRTGATPLHATLASGNARIAQALRAHGGR